MRRLQRRQARWMLAGTALVLLGLGAWGLSLVNWGGVGHALSCPSGQQLTLVSFTSVWISTGSGSGYMSMTPIYACEVAS